MPLITVMWRFQRDVFAVNKAIQTSRSHHLSQSTRLFETWRGKAKGSRECTRRLSTPIYVRLIRSREQNTRGNYIPNYDNVVISTRDVFAVIKGKKSEPLIFSLIRRRIDEKADIRWKIRGVTGNWTIPTNRTRKGVLTVWLISYVTFMCPTEQRQNRPIVPIWLLNKYMNVAKVHSSKLKYEKYHICNYRNNYHDFDRGHVTNELECVHYILMTERNVTNFTHLMTDRGKQYYITRDILWVSNMMVTTVHMSRNFKQSIFKQHYPTIITITKVVLLVKGEMEKQVNNTEVQHAVEHIPGPSNTCTILDEFISTQTSEPSARAPAVSTVVSQQNQATAASAERYEYDPINDCMKVITNTIQYSGCWKREAITTYQYW